MPIAHACNFIVKYTGIFMKEFLRNQKVTYNLMSFTGYKALVLFSLLADGPKSYREICDYFLNHPYLRESISIDTLRVYINSLKRVGCEVKRIRGEDKESRYVILSHPFELKITQEQIQSIIKVYKSIVKRMDVQELLDMDNLFEKIGKFAKNPQFTSDIKKISMLRDINKEILRDLLDCCDKKEQIVISYNSPNTGEKDIEIIADKIEISNGKIYLYGIGFEYKQYGSFLVSRINQIKEIKLEKTIPDELQVIRVIYEIEREPDKIELNENEKIIGQNKNKTVIEVVTSNEFLLRQRLLEYGPLCKIIHPDEFKDKFVELLKDMKAGYYCD